MRTALQWVPGAPEWVALPDMAFARSEPAAVALPDGRVMTMGGFESENDRYLASVEVLAADGSGWSALAPMHTARNGHAAAVLPCGKVLVAGGCARGMPAVTAAAELWDPATGAWSELPPLTVRRGFVDGCVLPSGRAAVVGGVGNGEASRDGETFDLDANVWQALPAVNAPAATGHWTPRVVAVAGGLLTLDSKVQNLYDEASGRWFELPHPMAQPRNSTRVVSIPASALQAPPPAAAGATAAP